MSNANEAPVFFIFLILLSIVLLNLMVHTTYWLRNRKKQTFQFSLFWINQLAVLLLAGVFDGSALLMAIPFSFNLFTAWIIYNIYFKDRGQEVRSFGKTFAPLFGLSWLLAVVSDSLFDSFSATTFPVAVGFSVPLVYMMYLSLLRQEAKEFQTFHHRMLAVFLGFTIVHNFNFVFFRDDPSTLLWGMTGHIFLVSAISINLNMFHTFIAEEKEKKKLRQLVAERTGDLKDKVNQLEKSNEEKSALFRIVLHDISNPVNAVTGYLDCARRPQASEQQKHDYLEGARLSALALVDTIKQVRAMEALEGNSSSFFRERLSLKKALETADTVFRRQYERKSINLYIEHPQSDIVFKGNKELFTHSVLGNVLSNALKFSPSGSEVKLAVEEHKDSFCVKVEDQGVGIKADILKTVFKPSSARFSLGTNGERGLGYGLPLVKRYLDEVGGSIQINAGQAKTGEYAGTTVIINLKKFDA